VFADPVTAGLALADVAAIGCAGADAGTGSAPPQPDSPNATSSPNRGWNKLDALMSAHSMGRHLPAPHEV
jgi:hypothetical protein